MNRGENIINAYWEDMEENYIYWFRHIQLMIQVQSLKVHSCPGNRSKKTITHAT